MKRFLNYSDRKINGFSRVILLLAAGCIILLVGSIHYALGRAYALSLFFLFPIVFSAWCLGVKSGLFMSVCSTIVWLSADLMLAGTSDDVSIYYLNETFRLAVFLFVAVLVAKLKDAMEAQKKIARTDPLTGISNRLAFFETADREMNRAQRFSYPLSIIYVDIDNFKFINDSSGHRSGDLLLQAVADTISGNIRSIDVAARIGGDEIGILLPETGVEGALSLAEKLQKKLNSRMGRHGWPVTFSMGVATFPNVSISVGDMLNVADKLMYHAKKGGKNRITHRVFAVNPDIKQEGNEIRILR